MLNREVVTLLATTVVTISVHEDTDDEADETTFTIYDDGDEFDDDEVCAPDVQGAVDERRTHYLAIGHRVVIDAPDGRGWL